jgi:hypothetical protein
MSFGPSLRVGFQPFLLPSSRDCGRSGCCGSRILGGRVAGFSGGAGRGFCVRFEWKRRAGSGFTGGVVMIGWLHCMSRCSTIPSGSVALPGGLMSTALLICPAMHVNAPVSEITADRKPTRLPLAMGWYPPLARKDSTGEFLFASAHLLFVSGGAAEVGVHRHVPDFEQPFGNVASVPVLFAPAA